MPDGRASAPPRAGDPDGPLAPDRAAAVDAACAEVGRITDPHRAIDWLSTFPAVVELALAAAPAAPAATQAPGATPAAGGPSAGGA